MYRVEALFYERKRKENFEGCAIDTIDNRP